MHEKPLKSPTLSVIVPTRDRCDTLGYTLKTLVGQAYADCEFIVSDNCSWDDTRKVVETFNDSRLRYINTGARVSMSDNWEFALSHARGSYITYIGDDDGFVPDALDKAMSILARSSSNALVWEKVDYCWPDHIDDQLRNWFSMKNRRYALRTVSGRQKLRQVMRFTEGYTRLPCLYNGIIRKSLLDEIKSRSINNVFFNSITPDIFSGISLSMVVGSYLHTDYPFSVNGASRHSNGTSFSRQRTTSQDDNPHSRFISENNRQYPPSIRMGPSPFICVMGEYLFAKEYLPELGFWEPSWRKYVKSLLRNAKGSFLPDEILASAQHTINYRGMRVKLPATIERRSNPIPPNLGFRSETFNFIPPGDMVTNIHDACRLVGGMLPDIDDMETGSALKLFLRRMAEYFFVEAKILYRSF